IWLERKFVWKHIWESFISCFAFVWETCQKPVHYPNKLCVLLYVVLSSFMLLTICGNLLVIISIIYFRYLHTPTNYLILSMAVADLLIGALIFPLSMTVSLKPCLYIYSLLCNLRSTMDVTMGVSSLLNLCCISVDRYYAVCHPLIYKTKITDCVAMKMGLGSWAVAILCGIFEGQILFYAIFCLCLFCHCGSVVSSGATDHC
uniref:G-protein coupled receptors family 1 profile domain-containing protein n=1 Tax=Pundamilia nyererei TaxID=303518 RepID=A0A3B4FBB6_9CICH